LGIFFGTLSLQRPAAGRATTTNRATDENPAHRPATALAAPGGHRPLKALDDFSLHDVEALRLVLSGTSVIDWHRLHFRSLEEARAFIHIHELDPDAPSDREYMDHIKAEAISYLRRNFAFSIPRPVEQASIEELLLLASGQGHRQLCACTILKALQIINHMAGRELLFCLPVSDRDLFHFVEEKVYRVIGTMLSEGFPITEFIGGRKNPDSTYTKLLSKPEATAAALYDKLRFRIVTRSKDHILPVLLYLTERLFRSQRRAEESANTILPSVLLRGAPAPRSAVPASRPLRRRLLHAGETPSAPPPTGSSTSSRTSRAVPPGLMELAPDGSKARPHRLHLGEFQIPTPRARRSTIR
jgi:hypothetical protein